MSKKPDYIKEAIEAKILEAIRPVKWKTLKVATQPSDKGVLVAIGLGTRDTTDVYKITVKKVRTK